MSTESGDRGPISELERARRLLSANAIRALAADRWQRRRAWLDWPALAGFVVLLAVLFAPPGSGVIPVPPRDSIATETVRAERDVLVEDRRVTELRRRQAAQSVRPIFNYDPEVYFELGDRVSRAVTAMAERAEAGTLDPGERRAAFAKDLGQPINAAIFSLVEELDRPTDLAVAINFFLNIALDRMVVADRAELPETGGIQVLNLVRDTSRPLHDLGAVLDLKQVQRLMRARAGDAPYGAARIVRTWVLDTALGLARPNLEPDPVTTEERRREARAAVEPAYLRIASGEVLIREGDRVTAAVQERIRMLNKGVEDRTPWAETVAFALLLAGLIALCGFFFRYGRQPFRLGRKEGWLALTVVLLVAVLSIGTFYAGRGLAEGMSFKVGAAAYLPPVALATVLISILVDSRTSLLAGLALAIAVTYRVDGDLWLMTYFIVGVLTGGVAARWCRRRSDLLKAGVAVGGAQALAIPLLFVLGGGGLEAGLVPAIVSAIASGALTAICATGLLPVIEYLFDEATDMRLLEQASADNPLLKQLALRSPGTYYHSVMIGNLAEAAADAVGANALQCRVMALYHDVGKMRRPSYFAENQRDGNIHDRLPPELSARIVFAHVKDGVDIARKHRLGRPILDAITQHQGTTLLRVFHGKALERARETGATVDEAEFRYPGPKPTTRESGILLLADSVEATTRALKSPSPVEVGAEVRRVIRDKVADGQLDDCPLTLADLARIEAAFTRVLTLGVYHSRIEYPPPPAMAPHHDEPETEDRSSDRVPSVVRRPH